MRVINEYSKRIVEGTNWENCTQADTDLQVVRDECDSQNKTASLRRELSEWIEAQTVEDDRYKSDSDSMVSEQSTCDEELREETREMIQQQKDIIRNLHACTIALTESTRDLQID
jgi:hypothetical protein